jgi:hypothetical protein
VLTLTQPLPSVYTPIGVSASVPATLGLDRPCQAVEAVAEGRQVPARGVGRLVPLALISTDQVGGFTDLRGTNWYGGGKQNLLNINAQGQLVSYPQESLGQINYGAGEVVGTNWNQFVQVIPTNNFTGDGRPDLIAERPDGTLWLYERNGNGWLNGNGVQIGSGFGQFANLVAFQWMNSGHLGLLGETESGTLEFYGTDGAGHRANNGVGQAIGTGFSSYLQLLGPGSWAGRDTGAILALDTGGNLFAYYADGNGGWSDNGARTLVGTGWNTINEIF